MKLLSPLVHGVVDYAVVAAFALAPTLFDFGGNAATISYVLAAVHLSLSLLTRYPLGMIKKIAFTTHGAMEAAIAVALVAMPWIAGFADTENARNFFIGSGIAVALVWLTTQYRTNQVLLREADWHPHQHSGRAATV
ncbi:MAG: hypothetical protein H0V44_06200 [Planctomycetes bacterium]|nr:hypothetical protein [Planctomycetota bacterium]